MKIIIEKEEEGENRIINLIFTYEMKQFRFHENEYDFIYFRDGFLTIFVHFFLVWALSHVLH